MSFIGDFPEDFTSVPVYFTTHAASGAAVAPSSAFEAADVRIYKNGSATEKTSTNGLTMTSPFDTVTGLHCLTIDTSNDTGDGGFWVAGATYTVVLAPDETVDSLAVVKVLATFSLAMNLRAATAGRTVVVDAAGLVDANAVKVGPTGAGTAQTARDIGASVLLSSGTGTGQVKLSSGYVAPNWGDVGNPTTTLNLSGTTVKTATDIATLIGVAGAGLTATDDAVIAAIAALNNITAASVWAVATRQLTAAQTFDITGNLSGTVGSVTGAVGSVAGLTVAHIDAAVSTRASQTSVDDVPTNAELATALGTADDAVLAQVALVKAKTDGLPTDPADQSLIIAATDAIVTAIGALNNITAASVWAAGTRTLTAGTNIALAKGTGVTGFNDLSAAQVNAEADTAIVDAALATAANLATLSAFVDTEVAAIKAVTDALGAASAALLKLSAGTMVTGTVNDAVTTPTTTVFAATDITEATADHFIGRVIIFTTGALAKQATEITDYALVGGEGKFTVAAMTEAAADGDTFLII